MAKFFTADDVLSRVTTTDPTNPVTIGLETTIQEALETMFKYNFSLLPVTQDGTIEGAISYLSICRVLKSINHHNVSELTVKSAIEEPVFVSAEKDIYDLFDTFASDQYILVGSPEELKGVMTRYDIFYFLKGQVEPFLLIGEIEQSLRELFEKTYPDINTQIQETFAERAEHDPAFDIPQLHEFDLGDYQFFLGKNWEDLSTHFYDSHDYIDGLLDEVRDIRNSIFHFREGADRIDSDKLRIAHAHIATAA